MSISHSPCGKIRAPTLGSALVFLFSLRQAVLAAMYAELTGKQDVGECPASASHIPMKIMCALLHLAFKCILIISTQVSNP